MALIKDVYVSFARVNSPVVMHKKKHDPSNPLKDKEYTVTICLRPSQRKELLTLYKGKGVKSLANIKETSAEDFEEVHKYLPPEEFMNGDGDIYTLKLTAHASYKSGAPTRKPEIRGVELRGKQYYDMEGEKVGRRFLVGNGSYATIQYKDRAFKNPEDGSSGIALTLLGLLIKRLVPYEGLANEMDSEITVTEGTEEDNIEHVEERDDYFNGDIIEREANPQAEEVAASINEGSDEDDAEDEEWAE